MAHYPVNHPLRPVYRALGGLAGLYLLAFGILGAIATAGDGLFGTDTDKVLGQGTNLAWSVLSALAGLAVLAGTALGGNRDVALYTYLGWGLLVVGLATLAVIRTDVNVFHFSMATVVVTFVVGLALITAGLYSRVAAPRDAGAPRQVRQRA
ncbi:MAG TPA: DUF4383 domain-containing protein [Catenuloplanes sp.]|jgi:hypothetical protein